MEINYKATVSMDGDLPFERVGIAQDDSARHLIINLVHENKPYTIPKNAKIIFNAKNAGGFRVSRDDKETIVGASGSQVFIKIPRAVAADPGTAIAELQFVEEGVTFPKTLRTATFFIDIWESALSNKDLQNDDDLQSAIEAAISAVESAKKASKCAQSACDSATILNNMLLYGVVVKYVADDMNDLNANFTPALGDFAIIRGDSSTSTPSKLYVYAQNTWHFVQDFDLSFNTNGLIYTNADLKKYIGKNISWQLMNNVVFDESILIDKIPNYFNLQGYTLTVHPSKFKHFTGSKNKAFFHYGMVGSNFSEDAKRKKVLKDGVIDCSDVIGFAFNIRYFTFGTITNITVLNNRNGLLSYDPFIDTGNNNAQSAVGSATHIDNVRIKHSVGFDDKSVGVHYILNDGFLGNIGIEGFEIGFVNQSSNSYVGQIHPWGYVNDGSPEVGTITRICIITGGESTTIHDSVVDTAEPLDLTKPASYENGGIGILCYGVDTKFEVKALIHPSTIYKGHIPFWIDIAKPLESGEWTSSIVLNNCSVERFPLNSGKKINDYIDEVVHVSTKKMTTSYGEVVDKPAVTPEIHGNFTYSKVNDALTEAPNNIISNLVLQSPFLPNTPDMWVKIDALTNQPNMLHPYNNNNAAAFVTTDSNKKSYYINIHPNIQHVNTMSFAKAREADLKAEMEGFGLTQPNSNLLVIISVLTSDQTDRRYMSFDPIEKAMFWLISGKKVDWRDIPEEVEPSIRMLRLDVNMLWSDNKRNKERLDAIEAKLNSL